MKKHKMKNLIITGIIIGLLFSFSNTTAEEPAWSYETSGSVLSVASTEDTVVVGSRGGTISVFGINGASKWRYKTNGDVGSISISEDTVAVGSVDNHVYVFEKNTGRLRWNANVGEFPNVAVSDNVVATGTYDNQLYVLDKSNGNIIWNRTGIEEIENIFSLAITGNILVVATFDWEVDTIGYVHAFDIDTGEELWERKINGWVYTLAVSDDTIVAGSWEKRRGLVFEQGKGGVYAFDKSGNLKWEFPAEEDITSVAVSGDRIAFGVGHTYDEDKVYLVDKDTGEILWEQYTRAPIMDLKSPYSVQWLALTDDSVIFGARDGKVYTYEKETGCERWNYRTKADVHTVTAFNGKVIAGSLDRSVYVFDEGKGSGWCKRQMDKNTLRIIEICGILIALIGVVLMILLFSGKIGRR